MAISYPKINQVDTYLSGFYRIDHEAYHHGPGISSSDIKAALVSYGHYRMKKNGVFSETAAMAFGTAFHMAILEPELFTKSYITPPKFGGHPNSAGHKHEKSAWTLENLGKEIISEKERELIEKMEMAVRCHPAFDSYRNYTSELMGLHLGMKCKMDLFGGEIVDLKTTECASEDEFDRAVLKYGYHISAAYYREIVRRLTGEVLPFVFIVAEKKPPYGVAFYELPEEYLAAGLRLAFAGLKRIESWDDNPPESSYGTKIKTLLANPRVLYSCEQVIARMEE